MTRAFAIACLVASGCSLVTRFDLSKVSESSNALCADGIDNDGNGLTDCQDFGCLGQLACCDQPVVVLSDDFSRRGCAQASCDAPDPSCALDPTRWQPWGLPNPSLCGGGLNPNKVQLCYDVGVLGQAPLALHPGLVATVDIAGIPETAGRLIVGLTLQEQVAGGQTACAPIEGLSPVLAAQTARSADGGYVVLAIFDGNVIGSSATIYDADSHQIRISVGGDRRVTYAVDGTTISVSPASEPLPADAPTARLGLAGRGTASRFLDVRVSDGTQCDAPAAWTPSTPFVALEGTNDSMQGWDSYATYSPAVMKLGDQTLLYYSGCPESPIGGACSQQHAIGLALSDDGLTFTRYANNPVEAVRSVNALEVGLLHDVAPAATITAYLSNDALASFNNLELFAVQSPGVAALSDEGVPAIPQGAAGSWDDAEVCCATAVSFDGVNVSLWFAGHSAHDPTWRIGLARSTDGGVTFVEEPHNPIVREGASDAFDGRGVTDPEVLWDASRKLYRMWYTAQAFLGRTSIGYAVSTDGVSWHKFPGNPVLLPSAVGLEEIGSPALLADDAGLRMWLHGREPSTRVQRIYQLANTGAPPQ